MNGMWQSPMGRGYPPQGMQPGQPMMRHGAPPGKVSTPGRGMPVPMQTTPGNKQVPRNAAVTPSAVAKVAKAPEPREEAGHFFSSVGETVDKSSDFPGGRYVIVRKLGSGTYGKVLECGDNKYNKCPVAVKIIRKDPPIFREAAKREILVLRDLDGRHGCIKMLRHFEHQGHICMSFEILGESLCNMVKRQGALSLTQTRDVGHQLTHAVEYMHAHSFIHTDVKTDNILVAPLQWPMPPGSTDQPFCVKLADMGSTIKSSEWHAPLIGTLECRAPESVLQAGWSFPVDVWAIGCVLLELISGRVVFAGTTTEEGLLMLMEQVTSRRMPGSIMTRGLANLNQYNTHVLMRDQRTGGPVLRKKRQHRGLLPVPPLYRMVLDTKMLHLMSNLLDLDPDTRWTAAQVKDHPFFQDSTFDQNFLDEHGRLLPKAIVQEQQRKMQEKAAAAAGGGVPPAISPPSPAISPPPPAISPPPPQTSGGVPATSGGPAKAEGVQQSLEKEGSSSMVSSVSPESLRRAQAQPPVMAAAGGHERLAEGGRERGREGERSQREQEEGGREEGGREGGAANLPPETLNLPPQHPPAPLASPVREQLSPMRAAPVPSPQALAASPPSTLSPSSALSPPPPLPARDPSNPPLPLRQNQYSETQAPPPTITVPPPPQARPPPQIAAESLTPRVANLDAVEGPPPNSQAPVQTPPQLQSSTSSSQASEATTARMVPPWETEGGGGQRREGGGVEKEMGLSNGGVTAPAAHYSGHGEAGGEGVDKRSLENEMVGRLEALLKRLERLEKNKGRKFGGV